MCRHLDELRDGAVQTSEGTGPSAEGPAGTGQVHSPQGDQAGLSGTGREGRVADGGQLTKHGHCECEQGHTYMGTRTGQVSWPQVRSCLAAPRGSGGICRLHSSRREVTGSAPSCRFHPVDVNNFPKPSHLSSESEREGQIFSVLTRTFNPDCVHFT